MAKKGTNQEEKKDPQYKAHLLVRKRGKGGGGKPKAFWTHKHVVKYAIQE